MINRRLSVGVSVSYGEISVDNRELSLNNEMCYPAFMKKGQKKTKMTQKGATITITIQSLLDVSKVVGGREIPLTIPEGTNVRQLLDILIDKWGRALAELIFNLETGRRLPYMKFMVNGRSINLINKLDTVLKDKDVFFIFPPVGGG